MKNYAVVIGAIALAIVVALWVVNARVAKAPGPSLIGPVSLEARIDQKVSGLGVDITPLAVLQDSRCPVDVQCIQAGTVKIRARLVGGLGTAMQEFTIGQPITTETEMVTLTAVSPQPKAGIKIPDSEYVFRFEVTKR